MKFQEGPDGQILQVEPIAADPGEGVESEVEHGPMEPGGAPKSKGRSDYQTALEAISLWGRPLAHFSGSLWSTNEVGSWVVCDSEFMSLLGRLRGRSGRSILNDLVAPLVGVPSLDGAERPAAYWERDLQVGRWVPLHLERNQVLFTDGVVTLPVGAADESPPEDYEPLRGRQIFGAQITVPYSSETGEAPECSEFQGLVEHCIPDIEQRRHFQELCGTILQPHSMLRGQIALYGPPMCGKTTLATALACAPAGFRGMSVAQEAEIVRDKWASLSLVNKFANVSDESRPTELWVSWMKRYTSGTYTVEPKYHKAMGVPSTAKLISTTNELQDMADVSGAAGLRFFPFRLDRPLPTSAGIEHTDRMTPTYWSEPARRAGVVAWLLEGLRRLWARSGRFDEPQTWKTQRTQAMAISDPVEGWLLSEVTVDPKGSITHSELIESAPPMNNYTSKSLEMKLPGYMQRLFAATRGRVRVAGVMTKVWKGVSLK